jgi:hypothetical protein
VFGCATAPPIVDGKPLWQAQPVSLPDLNNPTWRNALKLENFVFPYAKMDIPTPPPFHLDTTTPPDPALKQKIFGSPALQVDKAAVKIGNTPGSGATVELVNVLNAGTGVLAWYATPSVPWLTIAQYAGVAVGGNLPCAPNVPCERSGRLEISVDATRAPPGRQQAAVRLQALGTSQAVTINVDVSQVTRLGAPGVIRN